MTRKKEDFIPFFEEWKAEFVGMYSCGPTVYHTPHIWNYKASFTADLIRNTLKYMCGYPTKTVMNFTDVGHLTSDADTGEDKLEKGAKREGITAREVARKYEAEFLDWLKKLNIDVFDVMPRATDHIQQQIALVKILEEKGYTYEVPGDGIYMDTSKIDDYGKLMGPNYKKRLENLNAGERIDMGGKKLATDFALRKFSPTNEKRQMERDSPWGVGFPGWHIECSAMSSEYLGQQFDVHHGGIEHVTVHHSDEIAQSESAFWKKPWVKYWMHNALLQVDGGKMGKSLGNAYTLTDIEEKWFSLLDLRYFFFIASVSTTQNFSWESLEVAKTTRKNLQKKIEKAVLQFNIQLPSTLPEVFSVVVGQYPESEQFLQAIDESIKDNLNTPKLLSVINNALANPTKETIEILYQLDQKYLKCWLFDSDDSSSTEIPTEITELAHQRLTAKAEKNYALADELRAKIQEQWYVIKDIPWGFEIEKN